MGDEKSPVKIDISAGAKLNVDVKTDIPAESSGRFLDALTDVIRPFTEKRGLKADQIRLQREEVLIEVAQRAQQRLAIENVSPKVIPNRILVPLLEKASLSSLDDENLIEAWSNILASASKGEGANHSIYADILSKMDPQHLNYLEFLVGADDQSGPLDECLECSKDVLNAEFEKLMSRAREKFPSNSKSATVNDFINGEVNKTFRKHGIKVISGGSEFGEISSQIDLSKFSETTFSALDCFLITDTLQVNPLMMWGTPVDWLRLHRLTFFGFDFYSKCKGLPN